jgi:hypothetical protein
MDGSRLPDIASRRALAPIRTLGLSLRTAPRASPFVLVSILDMRISIRTRARSSKKQTRAVPPPVGIDRHAISTGY